MTLSFGFNTTRPSDDVIAVLATDFSTIGLCSTSDDAAATVFPLNRAVRFTSTDPKYLAKIGTGHLADALTGINAQLAGAGADVIVVRVAEGVAADAGEKLDQTFANILGDAGLQTGLWALRAAGSTTGKVPRLIGVPGYTLPRSTGIAIPNPILAALPSHLEALKAIAVCDIASGNLVTSIAARQLLNSDRIMVVGVQARVYETVNGAATLVTRSMAARVLGLIVATDNNYDGKPFDSFANKPILGIAGVSRVINFALSDGSTEAQQMLAADVAVVIKGELANDGAIADGGFTFIGVESTATGDLWSQIHQVRGADYIDLKMAKITREYLGGRITLRRAEAWLAALKFMLNDHVTNDDILGYLLQFPRAINSVNDVQLGELSIRTHVEPAPVFRRANNEVRRYRPAVQGLIDAIVASSGEVGAIVNATDNSASF